jgi:hypothetical protein
VPLYSAVCRCSTGRGDCWRQSKAPRSCTGLGPYVSLNWAGDKPEVGRAVHFYSWHPTTFFLVQAHGFSDPPRPTTAATGADEEKL